MYRVLVTGSRNWTDYNKLVSTLNRLTRYTTDTIVIVHGDCPTGADALADVWARENGYKVEKHPANWAKYGRSAGPKRNQKMVDLGASICVAFPLPDSRGTLDCIKRAKGANIPVKVVSNDLSSI